MRLHWTCTMLKFLQDIISCDGFDIKNIEFQAYQYSNCKKIIGIEISDQLCQIQTTIVQKYAMQDRIEVWIW